MRQPAASPQKLSFHLHFLPERRKGHATTVCLGFSWGQAMTASFLVTQRFCSDHQPVELHIQTDLGYSICSH
jgi:hypothetical protein